MASLTYYAILGVPVNAKQLEIERAYYELRNESVTQGFLIDRKLVCLMNSFSHMKDIADVSDHSSKQPMRSSA